MPDPTMIPPSWLPDEYMDESVPPLRAWPEDWLMLAPDGTWHLIEEDMAGNDTPGRALADGEVIAFAYRVDLGRGTLTVELDGDECRLWSIDFPTLPAPPGTSLSVWLPEHLALHPSLEEAASELDPGCCEAWVYAWSSPPIRFRHTAGTLERIDA